MARDWEALLRSWSKPPSETEQTKCENAERMIREAVRSSPTLKSRTIEVFTQGSYRNNTNVRLDSDVDICVRCMDVLFDDYSMSGGLSREQTGITPASYTYSQYKDELGSV
ncbi:MAG TPA: nucleotidyltransferase domain-containing protein [Longimicrobiaceae bacterium]|nr:nucleotidyltransferase domain-containing protein [Longimicrobiaceae bacterium]